MKEYSICREDLKKFAYQIFSKISTEERPVFLCVGTDKLVVDSLAPIVGELLTKKYNIYAYVYGGLDYNINAENLSSALNYIEVEHPTSQIILIDATLGENVGKVLITEGCFAGLGRVLPIRKIGNFSILGVVERKGKSFLLNTTRLKVVVDLAKFIAKGIAMAIDAKSQFYINRQKIS